MDAEIYLDRNTFIHRLDPRTKILILMMVFVVVLYFEHPLWVLPTTLLILLQGYFSKSLVNLKRIRLILIILTISSLILWNLFSRGVTPLFGPITVEGLLYSFNRILVMTSLITAGHDFPIYHAYRGICAGHDPFWAALPGGFCHFHRPAHGSDHL